MFKEEEHPRDNGGKFTDKGKGSERRNERIQWARENSIDLPLNADGSLDDLKLQELYDTEQAKQNSNGGVNLSKQEWAMFYERIGKIKNEGHYVPKTSNGEMIIPIETAKSNVIILAKGTHQRPIVKLALRFENNEYMYRMIEILEDI